MKTNAVPPFYADATDKGKNKSRIFAKVNRGCFGFDIGLIAG